MGQLWNDIDSKKKPKDSDKNLSQCHFVHQNPRGPVTVANPSLRGVNPAANNPSYGAVLVLKLKQLSRPIGEQIGRILN
jgi:hypothetical protein